MKFVCLGYLDETQWGTLGAAKQAEMIEACTDYDIELQRGGHFAGGTALQGASTATTVRWKGGKAVSTDGPFAETKELLGGILILEAKDKEEAVRLIMRHPGIRMGGFEVRPADEAFMAQHPVMKELQE
ncbi:MAG TPA: YciI family protein [Steroidobacteraceae bacterium]